MNAAAAVSKARRRIGITQRELAERSGVPQSTVARIESGSAIPRVDTLDKLLRICDESLEALPMIGIGVDRTLIREHLRLTPAERLRLASDEANALARFVSMVKKK